MVCLLCRVHVLHKTTASEPRAGTQSARPVGAVQALPKKGFGNSLNI